MTTLIEPTSLWTAEDRAWFAGFFEGEGYVSNSRHVENGKRYYKLGIAQVNPEPLARVHALCGGTVRMQTRTGRSAHILRWECSGERARKVVREVLPLLSAKRTRQLSPVIEWTPEPRATHCRRGHEFTPENTYTYPDGRRNCKTCGPWAYPKAI